MTRTILLLGSDHTELGHIVIEELSPNVAIGISRGRFPKGYAHVDPNEDAVFASTDGTTTVLAVTDGHHGFDAARAAIEAIHEATPRTTSDSPEATVRDLTTTATKAVSEAIPKLSPPRDTSRTALTICVIRDNTIAAATIGDTTCFVSTKRHLRRIGTSSLFLGPDTDPQLISIDIVDVPPGSAIVLVSDGFTDFAASADRSVRDATKQTPEDAVKALIADAFAGGAGDNVAVVVYKAPA